MLPKFTKLEDGRITDGNKFLIWPNCTTSSADRDGIFRSNYRTDGPGRGVVDYERERKKILEEISIEENRRIEEDLLLYPDGKIIQKGGLKLKWYPIDPTDDRFEKGILTTWNDAIFPNVYYSLDQMT